MVCSAAARLVGGDFASPTLAHLEAVFAGGVAGVLAYTGTVFALNIKETRALPGLLRRRH